MKILVIAAHMDDETLGPGGTVARHVRAGDEVHCCVVANRAYEHIYNDELIRREQRACRKACGILGYADVHFLDLPDERLDQCLAEIVIPLETVVGRVCPEVVYTHHRGDLNQDHRAVAHASFIACRPLAARPVRRLLSYEVPSSTEQAPPLPEYAFQPNFFVDIAETLSQKCEALSAYVRELRQFPHPRSAKALEIIAQKRGMEVGCHAAEAFHVLRDSWLA